MKVTLPIIGQVKTGKDTEPEVVEKVVQKIVQKELGAGFIDLSSKSLSNYKTVSDRLLKSFEGWVYANVTALAEEISQIEFELYKPVMRAGEIEWEETETHPALELLDRWNPFTTTSQAVYLIEAHLELTGDAFIYKEGAPGNITNLFILQPDMVTVVPGGASENYEIVAYDYKYKDAAGKEKVIRYTPEEIVHIKTPNPNNPYRGKSVVEAAALDIDTDNLAQEMLKMFFKNGAVPNMTLTTDQRLTPDDIQRIGVQVRRTYGGVRNAFKTLILGNGLTPTPVQQSAREMQLLEIENAMRDKIMAMFKNTKASLGITDDVNRANAEATLISWKQSVIKPKMTRIVDALNEFLIPQVAPGYILGFDDPVPENRDEEVNEVIKLKGADIISQNEARLELGLEAVEGGDEFSRQRAERLTSQVPEPVKMVSYKKHLRKSGFMARYSEYKKLYAEAYKIAQKSKKPVKKAEVKSGAPREHTHYTNEQVWQYHEKKMQIVDNSYDNFKQKVDKFLLDIEERSVANLHQAVGKSKTLKKSFELFNPEAEVQAGIDLFTPLLEQIGALSAAEAYALLEVKGGYVPSKALKDTLAANVELFVGSVIDTDKSKLTDILEQGISQGSSIQQIEQSIRTVFGDFRKTQSERIARTETLRASAEGTLDAYKQSGVVEAQQWLTASDDRVCEYCGPMNGKIIGLNKSWFSKGDTFYGTSDTPLKFDYASVDTPPLHVNCRCDLLPVLTDVQELSYQEKINQLVKEIEESQSYITELEKIVGVSDEQVSE